MRLRLASEFTFRLLPLASLRFHWQTLSSIQTHARSGRSFGGRARNSLPVRMDVNFAHGTVACVVRGGLTALLYAADGGHALAVEQLTAAGADFVSAKNEQG